ncbi:MAG: N-acetylmuramoyl-L-alanine amidase [Alphaproteobacteria bacterium]|nr:N-acetylmuramoyl-L-alanine amidase [Alphaproteobacteria bacterium]
MTTSPNCDERPADAAIDMLVLHYTGMATAEEAIARLCDPAAKVSAHYLIKESGEILALVPEEKRAWHAGKSYWRGKEGLNANSIGIEIVNPGHEFGYRDFKEAQYEALIPLCREILKRHAIPARNVVGHSDIAPDRKEDPGEKFDWERLAMEGIGLWPEALKRLSLFKDLGDGDKGERVAAMQKKLSDYGYAVVCHGEYDEATMLAALAFQRHFRQERLDAVWDWECNDRLNVLLEMAQK